MDSQTSRKIIVAGSMAAVLGIAVAMFALNSHRRTLVAPIPQSPPPAVAATPDVSTAVAPNPDAPAVAH
jgi:hypothetical protein